MAILWWLIDKSTKPNNFRKSKVTGEVILFIKNIKINQPRLGKCKIAYFLKDKLNIELSPSTIQNIVVDLKSKGLLKKPSKLYLHGVNGKLVEFKRKKNKFKLRRGGFVPSMFGELIQSDSIVVTINSKRIYILTAIDVWNRMAYAKFVTSHGSLAAKEFLNEIPEYFKYKIERVQTDNGSEFNLHFDNACKALNIIHYYNYPRSPKSNAYVERFNRSLQEEFLEQIKYKIDISKLNEINEHLLTYLKYYNEERPHWGLNLISPVKYTREKCRMCSV